MQETPEPENQGTPPDLAQNRPQGEEKARESKVHRLSQGKKLYTPKKWERKVPGLLTVEQYLRKAKQDEAIANLVRSLHKTKIMSFAEWERQTANLLKKKTW